MNQEVPALTKSIDESGRVLYHYWADQTWDGFDSLVKYLEKHWDGVPIEEVDEVYSRRWVLRFNAISIAICHDGLKGTYFVRDDGKSDQTLLESIEADLLRRLP
ncbi:hypothetical protein FIV34_09855 [Luteibacter pinisoli]|uniref:DUF3630 family protein n=1 Tax=Luteibacter pinisoli TaxID=2589080 RepID=A0A4Y5Z363_9GAMM|nr:hypothetical protein [Luteibacter pinisoli]QDE39484.1 hypothetical protein FIV34_09855 [Luteibacter pinisoli]